MSFSQFFIHPKCLEELKAQRITEATPIQSKAIPVALAGHDVTAVAQTGTGKLVLLLHIIYFCGYLRHVLIRLQN